MPLESTITLHDNMSATLDRITNSLDAMLGNLERVNRVSDDTDFNVDTSKLDEANNLISESEERLGDVRISIEKANDAYDTMNRSTEKMKSSIQSSDNQQKKFNDSINQGVSNANSLGSSLKSIVGAYLGISGAKKAFNWIQDCTDAFNEQLNAENQLLATLSNTLDQDYVSTFEAKADTGQAIDDINSIQDEVDDVTVHVNAETQALESEFDKITQKASEIQNIGIYGDEAMIAAGAEFATYFSDVDAITSMMDTLSDYAMGMTGGGAIDTQSMVDYATNLGKIMTGSYDAMTKKGFEFTDAQKAIIEGTATEAEIVDTLGKEYVNCSDDMKAAAAINQVIGESWEGLYETMSNTPEGKIIALQNRFGDLKETIGESLYPAVISIVDAINNNWPTIETIVQGISNAIGVLCEVIGWVINVALQVAQVFIDNWSWIGPIVFGIVAAFTAYEAILVATRVATALAEAAQWALNAAQSASPVMWVVMGFIALATVISMVVGLINQFCGTSISVIGLVTGAVSAAAAVIWNVVLTVYNLIVVGVVTAANAVILAVWAVQTAWDVVWKTIANLVISVAEYVVNGWNTAVNAIVKFFANIGIGAGNAFKAVANGAASAAQTLANVFVSAANAAITAINWIIDAMNMIPGISIGEVGKVNSVSVSFDSSGIDSAISSLESAANSTAETVSFDRFEYADSSSPELLSASDYLADYADVGDAFNAGYEWGSNLFSTDTEETDYTNTLKDLLDTANDIAGNTGDTANNTGSGGGGGSTGSNTGSTAANTADIASSLDITNDELKYLRDIAEQEAINRYTTAEINVSMTNNNTVNSEMDLDGISDYLAETIEEQMAITAEGVHS